jgi:subtilisin family serine protease
VAPLHAAGKFGQNVVVAVIDSGTANVSTLPALSGSIIGGETFVPAAQDPLSATHRENGSHGTMTAEMAIAHAAFVFPNASAFVQALNRYAPGSAIPCTSFPPGTCAPTSSVVFMTGTAPGAKVYAMKVFPATGGGAPSSRIIAAMDRAITLRRNFNDSGVNTVASGTGTESDPFVYSSLKIDVVNMSLGGPTGFAGRDVEDQLTLAMLDVGITVVVSAGNDGPAAMTGGSPGTGLGSLTTGAASTAVHERILRDLQFGPGAGEVYRASDHDQTAIFSARGPTADGRLDPDITANGSFSWVHAYLALTAAGGLVDCREPGAVPGTCQPRLVFASGTSFSGPTVSGGAAVLRGAHPTKSATQVRNALQRWANPDVLGDDSTRIDQGNGVVDVAEADRRLTSGHVSSHVPDLPRNRRHDDEDHLGAGGESVARNVERAGFRISDFRGNRFSTRVRNLKPGEVSQIFVPSDFLTSSFTVTVDGVTPELLEDQQNQFFVCGPTGGEFLCGDDVIVQIVDAPTSFAVERALAFVNSREPFTTPVDNPQTGLVRVAVMGDWTNAGRVSATVTITRKQKFEGFPTTLSTIEQDEIDFVEVDVPAGTETAVFELAWKQNWSRYPTNDLDLVLTDPAGKVNDSGASGNSPERVEIANPMPGRWRAAIIGFTIHPTDDRRRRDPKDIYTFRAEADGKRLRKVD